MVTTTNGKRALCGLFALLLVLCIFFFALPHDHSCGEADCPVCEICQLFKGIFIISQALFGTLCVLALVYTGKQFLSVKFQQTLVQLKVKLSN